MQAGSNRLVSSAAWRSHFPSVVANSQKASVPNARGRVSPGLSLGIGYRVNCLKAVGKYLQRAAARMIFSKVCAQIRGSRPKTAKWKLLWRALVGCLWMALTKRVCNPPLLIIPVVRSTKKGQRNCDFKGAWRVKSCRLGPLCAAMYLCFCCCVLLVVLGR